MVVASISNGLHGTSIVDSMPEVNFLCIDTHSKRERDFLSMFPNTRMPEDIYSLKKSRRKNFEKALQSIVLQEITTDA